MSMKHEKQLRQYKVFARTVLQDMFSVVTGHYHLLKYLYLEPKELLSETLIWLQTESPYPIEVSPQSDFSQN